MSKLAKKFLVGLSLIMLIVLLTSLFLNSQVITRYVNYQEKQDVIRISDELLAAAEDGLLTEMIKRIQEEEDVILAQVANTSDNVVLNERLRYAFLEKGIGLERYWLWEEDQLSVQTQGRQLRVYSQEKLHYSIMVEYLRVEDMLVAVAKMVPSTANTIALVNRVTGMILLGAIVIIFLLVTFLVKRITEPLVQIRRAAQSIANLDFQRMELHTGDELEELAADMNGMSEKLARAHHDLEEKNRQMEALLANVSHDLKTPVTLIQAYATGMQDGLDDGTFLKTIMKHNHKIQVILDRLLEYAMLKQASLPLEACRLDLIIREILSDYELQADIHGRRFHQMLQTPATVYANRKSIQIIIDNLVSNAIKYAQDQDINVTLQRVEKGWSFSICNHVMFTQPISIERLWEPFYVVDRARNAEHSGSGLGLAIVQETTQRYGFGCDVKLDHDTLTFTIVFMNVVS